jgi:very-short-patch-repair endonuclease
VSHLEESFVNAWKLCASGHAEPVREYAFALPRRFRFDFAWPEKMLAVEIEGGLYSGGRHTRISGFIKDCEKYNLAALAGWRVLRYTEKCLKNRPAQVVEEICEALKGITQ